MVMFECVEARRWSSGEIGMWEVGFGDGVSGWINFLRRDSKLMRLKQK